MNRVAARAFTLIEVVVALAVVALSMAALLGALNSSAEATRSYRERTLAAWVGFNQLALTHLSATVPTTGTTDGRFEMASVTWAWQRQVESMEIPGALKVTVRVRPMPHDEQTPPAKPYWAATVIGFSGDANAGNTPQGTAPNWQGSNFP